MSKFPPFPSTVLSLSDFLALLGDSVKVFSPNHLFDFHNGPMEDGYRFLADDDSDYGKPIEVKDFLTDDWEEKIFLGSLCGCFSKELDLLPLPPEAVAAISATLGGYICYTTNKDGTRIVHPYRFARIKKTKKETKSSSTEKETPDKEKTSSLGNYTDAEIRKEYGRRMLYKVSKWQESQNN